MAGAQIWQAGKPGILATPSQTFGKTSLAIPKKVNFLPKEHTTSELFGKTENIENTQNVNISVCCFLLCKALQQAVLGLAVTGDFGDFKEAVLVVNGPLGPQVPALKLLSYRDTF